MTSELSSAQGIIESLYPDFYTKQAKVNTPELKSLLVEAKSICIKKFIDRQSARYLLRLLSDITDEILRKTWLNVVKPKQDHPVALVAVGGYGRQELHPYSDVDILVLTQSIISSNEKHQIEQFLTILWDIGLDLGHSVRSIDDCVATSQQDITIATNLLESRLIIGDEKLLTDMKIKTGTDFIWPSNQFFEEKLNEQFVRYKKYNSTAYNLEPNLKEGPGGLRDIQMIVWVSNRHFGPCMLDGLVKYNFLNIGEYEMLINNQDFLWNIRYFLHMFAKRREDRLLFDYQKPLADHFGYIDDDKKKAIEHFMNDYFRTVTELSRLNEMLLQLFREAILDKNIFKTKKPVNSRFNINNHYLEISNENIFKRYPFALLEIFLILQQNQGIKGVRASTIRAVRNHLYLINDNFRNDIRCKSLFMEIFRQPTGLTHALRRMNRYGVLAAYLPEFSFIVGQMQYDLFHAYTVDEHTLNVVRNLRRFTVIEHYDEFPFCSDLIKTIPKPELLYISALYHDIAKGRGGDHSKLGATYANDFCDSHGLSVWDKNLVCWLVSNHLIMSQTAQQKDITDHEVIVEFSKTIKTETRLIYLYLLTVADIRGTNPTLWNNWKNTLLQQLFHATHHLLKQDKIESPDIPAIVSEKQKNCLQLIKESNNNFSEETEQAVWELWHHLDNKYFMSHTRREVAWQTMIIIEDRAKPHPLVAVNNTIHEGGTEFFVYAKDKKDLFALSALAFDQHLVNIQDARIFTSKIGYTLDTYSAIDSSGKQITDRHKIERIITTLKSLLRKEKVNSKIKQRIGRQLRHFNIKTKIKFFDDRYNNRTILEVITNDRPGLLSKLGHAFLDCNIIIHQAKIATLGEKVKDRFSITDKDNKPVKEKEAQQLLEKAIINHIDT